LHDPFPNLAGRKPLRTSLALRRSLYRLLRCEVDIGFMASHGMPLACKAELIKRSDRIVLSSFVFTNVPATSNVQGFHPWRRLAWLTRRGIAAPLALAAYPDQGGQFDPTDVDSNVVLIWVAAYLGLGTERI
jgi:hypothetical protein